MSFFGKILDKLGLSTAEAATASEQVAAPAPSQEASATPVAEAAPVESASPAISVVDVEAHLEELAAANPQKLNWKTSIVDLLKLLELDSSYAARKELAAELACPAEVMGESAKMNMWLHKTVLQKIADNGGSIPADLLD